MKALGYLLIPAGFLAGSVVAVQTDEIHVEFPVLNQLPGIKAIFQALVVKPDTLELIMLTNAALVYTERY